MKKVISIALIAMLVVAMAGCSQSQPAPTAAPAETPAQTTAAPQTEAPATAAALTGTVATDGSTSMEKVIGALGEAFMVSEGRCDIGLSSRALKDSEVESGLVGTVLAYDGIAVIVNPANTVEDLDTETIARIYTGEITNWSEVGGADAEIVLVGREAGSGTRSGFEELTETVDKCKYRQELTSTGDVITAVAQNPDAIGYASLASVKDSVKALKVAGVTPTEETVKDGTYLIQRPFVLVTKEGVALSPVAQAFFDYATKGQANDIITASGVVPANG